MSPTVPVGGLVANLLAVPIGELASLPVCLAHALLAPAPAAERGAALVASGSLLAVRAVARSFAAARWLAPEVPPPTAWQWVALAAGAMLAATARPGRRARAVLATFAGALLLELPAIRAGRPHGLLRVTVLDVGQGDAAIVDLPDGRAMLVDGGGLVGSPVDTGRSVILPVLRARRRSRVDVAVLSHPHPDHFLGLASALPSLAVGELWDTGQGEREGTAGAYAALLAGLRARGVPIRRPDALCGAPRSFGGAKVEVLAPCPGPEPGGSANDNSIVLRLSLGARAALLVGDAEHEAEARLLAAGPGSLHADFLKVGHHGSRTSSTPRFLAATGATTAAISTGVRNRFGHPHAETLRSLAAAGVDVLRTDRAGAILWETDGASVRVRTAAGGR
jgi:competence protein ComEC